MTIIEVDNTRCRLREVSDWALARLREQLAYAVEPTLTGEELQDGLGVPDEEDYHWDGFHRFVRIPKPRRDGTRAHPWFETGLLPRAMRVLCQLGESVQLLDFRRRPDSSQDVPRFWPREPLFPYQEAAVARAYEVGHGVVVAPPRAGKTRIVLELVRRLGLPTLLIAPTTSIVDQTADAARAYGFAPCDVLVLSGQVDWAEAADAQLWICTAGKVLHLPDNSAVRARQVVVCDELHHYTKAGAWGKALHKRFAHVYHWYGATGTHFRSGGDEMSLEAFLSGVVYRISSRELIDLGRLVPTRLAFVPTTPTTGALRRGQDPRRDGIHLSDDRNALVAAAALHLAQTGRRVLVMVALKQQGRWIADLINQHAPWGKRGEWKFAEFLFAGRGGAGRADAQFRRRLTDAFLNGEGPAVLLGTSLIGEGVDLPDADALVWARGDSAAVSYLQGLYRVCTASPGKTLALAVDFADRHHTRLLEASKERLAIALRDPVFEVEVLQRSEELGLWAQRS